MKEDKDIFSLSSSGEVSHIRAEKSL